ncbi:Yng1 [Kluyveromyces lactis]|nr:Yng1 [Kluyveromyces lactis]
MRVKGDIPDEKSLSTEKYPYVRRFMRRRHVLRCDWSELHIPKNTNVIHVTSQSHVNVLFCENVRRLSIHIQMAEAIQETGKYMLTPGIEMTILILVNRPEGNSSRTMDDVRYGFLSTLDHLPCDVIRTLWTIQSLDISDTNRDGCHSEEMLRQAQHLLELVRQEHSRLNFEKQELERFSQIKARYDGHLKKQPKLKPLPHHKPIKIKITMKSRYPEAEREQKLIQQEHVNHDKTQNPEAEMYCFCRDVSYGPMVACDNESCAIEWFHYPCVGLSAAPKPNEKWFCSDMCRKQYSNHRKKSKKRKRR